AHTEERDVVPRVEGDDVRREVAAASGDLDVRVALAGDDVGGGDDRPRSDEPAAPFDADSARGTEDANDRQAGGPNAAVAGDSRRGRPARSGRPGDRRQRIDAGE